jgi:hypothetical protein
MESTSQMMIGELLETFLQNPGRGSFLALRSAWLALPDIDPYTRELDEVPEMIMGERYGDALKLIRKHISPQYLLNPRTHMHLAMCLENTGDESGAKFERYFAFSLLDGIKSTGDGSEDRPFLVTRTSDEYDYLMAEGIRPAGQALIKADDGRKLDQMTMENGRVLYFDVTEIYDIMDRKFGGDSFEEPSGLS